MGGQAIPRKIVGHAVASPPWACNWDSADLALGALRPQALLTVRGNCVTLALPSEAQIGANIHQLPVVIAPARS